jgi:oligopeptidase B
MREWMTEQGSAPDAVRAPMPERVEGTRALHGELLVDEYAWMRDAADPRLAAYLEAERAYYEARSERLEPLRARLRDELEARLPGGPEYSVAWEVGDYVYRTRTLPDAENPQLLRAPRAGGALRS